MGSNVLRKMKMALLNKVTVINNRNAKAILQIMIKYHADPVEGRGHCGIFRTAEKIKRYYYSKNMTIAKYLKSCQNVNQQKQPNILKDRIGQFSRLINGNEYAITLLCD